MLEALTDEIRQLQVHLNILYVRGNTRLSVSSTSTVNVMSVLDSAKQICHVPMGTMFSRPPVITSTLFQRLPSSQGLFHCKSYIIDVVGINVMCL